MVCICPHRAESFNPAYLDYLLRTRAYVAEYIGRSTGIRASRLRLYPNQFLDIPLLQPRAPRARPDRRLPARAGRAYRPLHQGQARTHCAANGAKQTIIEGAVTQGLDPATEKRNSGIDWIPHLPALGNLQAQTRCGVQSVAVGEHFISPQRCFSVIPADGVHHYGWKATER